MERPSKSQGLTKGRGKLPQLLLGALSRLKRGVGILPAMEFTLENRKLEAYATLPGLNRLPTEKRLARGTYIRNTPENFPKKALFQIRVVFLTNPTKCNGLADQGSVGTHN